MCFSPRDRHKLSFSRFKERFAFGGDGTAFFGPNHIRLDPISRNAAYIGKRLGIDQGEQTMKSIGLSLVRSRR